MRRSLTTSVLLVLLVGVANAGEDRSKADRVGQLEHELRVARLEADLRRSVNEHLYALIDDLFARLREAGSPMAENEELRAALRKEQERHASDVSALHQELAKAMQRSEEQRLEVTQLQQRLVMLEKEIARAHAHLQTQKAGIQSATDKARSEAERAIELSKELDRVRWNLQQGTPKDSVASRLGGMPAAHWRAELSSGDAQRARVALSVLAVVSDPSPEGLDLVLHVAGRHRELLDRATGALVRIGAPAVEKLVDAARAGAVPPAWAMHVLGELGGKAKDALPWLAEVAEGEGRDAAAARRAIERIDAAQEGGR